MIRMVTLTNEEVTSLEQETLSVNDGYKDLSKDA